ncbi:transcriptional regulator [Serratia entomophila]|uniref:transcriptional regulator n=1 Tax=Serratia entomophila TaxID=42906 RepID=UPI002178A8D8|nr:winged helix family transcriptional regulator [Serratia entomophila]CAI0821817.1 DNA-binding transcriptional activator CadC [Serratia entomophila]CAI1541313.1 DNA-binding transcriptional activator CadC [Serratia entomophila]CAI1550235.1 DNA-binding transcriptional activator CadC [Serratia entomophila]CAI1634927.1 DNA-binding transcriptional activator CadC [Serratia entomophila]CAI1663328.1 DNA-binding transcriptional activator CadC [Serratia entomophila]
MKYVINSSIIFNTVGEVLSLLGSEKKTIRLSKPASRLMLMLIKNNNQPVSRDALFQSVWINDNSTASNAGLNNYISEIRKAIIFIGADSNIIVTIPKVGFKLESEIKNDVIVNSHKELENTVETQPHFADKKVKKEQNEDIAAQHQQKKPFPIWRQPLAATLFVIIILCAVTIIFRQNKPSLYAYNLIHTIDKCNIYSMGKIEIDNTLFYDIDQVLKEERIDCKNNRNDVFYMEGRIDEGVPRVSLLSICDKHQGYNYDHCISIKKQRDTIK